VTKRDRIMLLFLLVAGGFGGFYMLVLKPKREEASTLAGQLQSAQDRVAKARADLATGQQARATYAANYATVARLGKAVPTGDDVPSLVFQLDNTARETGVDFRSVKLSAGTGAPTQTSQTAAAAATSNSDQAAGAKPGAATPAASGAPAGATPAAATPTTGTPTAPAAPTQAATASLPPGAVVGPAGLSTMPFSFSFEGSFFRLSDFLTRIERYITPRGSAVDVNGRLLLVDGIALNAAATGFPRMKASIAATAYLLPASQGLFGGASPTGPSAATATPVAGGAGATTAPAVATP
jgi:hypothetical protein